MTLMQTAMMAMDPNDGNTLTCTTANGGTQSAPDPAGGIPFLGSLLNSAGNALTGTDCTQDGPYRIAGLIKSSADTIASTPSPTIATDNQAVGATAFISGHTSWIAAALFAVAVAIAGAKIAYRASHPRPGDDPIDSVLQLLIGMVVIIGCGAGIIQGILLFSDAYAPWIINQAGNGDYQTMMTKLLGDIPDPAIGDVGGWILAGVAWLAAGVQWLILHGIGAMIPLAVGMWALFASIEAIQSGRPWRTPITPVIFAMATYKFFVASFYAVAFAEIGTTTGGGQAGEGIMLLIIAILIFPMLIKVFSPFGHTPGTGVGAGAVGAGVIIAASAR